MLSLINSRSKHSAKLLTGVNVFPVNKIAEASSKLPAGVLLTNGCEFHWVTWPLWHDSFTLRRLPEVLLLLSVTTAPQHGQCFRSSARHDSKTKSFVSATGDSVSVSVLVSDDEDLWCFSVYSSLLSSSSSQSIRAGSSSFSSLPAFYVAGCTTSILISLEWLLSVYLESVVVWDESCKSMKGSDIVLREYGWSWEMFHKFISRKVFINLYRCIIGNSFEKGGINLRA